MKQSICIAIICLLVSGCASRSPDAGTQYQTVARDPRRDTDIARAENAKAVVLMEKLTLDSTVSVPPVKEIALTSL